MNSALAQPRADFARRPVELRPRDAGSIEASEGPAARTYPSAEDVEPSTFRCLELKWLD